MLILLRSNNVFTKGDEMSHRIYRLVDEDGRTKYRVLTDNSGYGSKRFSDWAKAQRIKYSLHGEISERARTRLIDIFKKRLLKVIHGASSNGDVSSKSAHNDYEEIGKFGDCFFPASLDSDALDNNPDAVVVNLRHYSLPASEVEFAHGRR